MAVSQVSSSVAASFSAGPNCSLAPCQIANQISQGQIDIGIACGVEHMSTGQDNPTLAPKMSEEVLKGEEVKDVLLPMGITSENVAKVFKVSREEQDAFAANSYQKALRAQKAGLFKGEIIPVEVRSFILLCPRCSLGLKRLSPNRSTMWTPRPVRRAVSSSMKTMESGQTSPPNPSPNSSPPFSPTEPHTQATPPKSPMALLLFSSHVVRSHKSSVYRSWASLSRLGWPVSRLM
jgi:hypothetical protein